MTRVPQSAERDTSRILKLLDAIRDGVFIFAPDTLRFTYVNEGAIAQVGYTHAELLTMTPLDIKPLFDEASFRGMLTPLVEGRLREHTFTTVHRRKDGRHVPVEIILQCVTVREGERALVALVRDITERKRAEDEIQRLNQVLEERIAERTRALQESELRLRRITDNMFDLVAQIDLAGGFEYVSPSYLPVLGYRPEDLLGQNAFDLLHPDDRVSMLARFHESIHTGQLAQVTVRLRHAEGRYLWVETTGKVLADEAGMPCRAIAVSRDISERKRVEEQFFLIFESAPDGMFLVERAGRITLVNNQMEKIFGYSRHELAGQAVELLIPERFRTEHHKQMRAYLANPQVRNLGVGRELFGRRRDGSEFPVEIGLTPISMQGDLYVLGVVIDITERKEAEQRLQQQLARLNLLHHITQAVGEHQDLSSIYQVVLAQLEDNLPMDLSAICAYEAATNSLHVAAVGPRSEALQRELGLGVGAVCPVEATGLGACLHGRILHVSDLAHSAATPVPKLAAGGLRSLVAVPMRTGERLLGLLVIARRQANSYTSADCQFLGQLAEHISLAAQHAQMYEQLKKAYDNLRESQKVVLQQERLRALGQMASGIAHDINNTISPIAVYAEALLDKEPNLSQRARNYLTTIAQAIDDVAHTVARMRDFYRQQEKQIELKPVDLNALVPQVLQLTRPRWRDQSHQRGVTIEVKTELTPGLPVVLGVESEIREALTNLILNAVDAMPRGGSLTIRTRTGARNEARRASPEETPTHVLVEVQDTGVGMDEETRQRCLEPFFTTKGERGTGLGLAMVYGAMQRHSGDIEIDSAPGRGTTVRLLFLLPQDLARHSESWHGPPLPLGSKRILVIDDDALLRKSLQDALQDDGHRVTPATGGQEGVALFRAAQAGAEPFDVVITDLGMPDMDGRAVAQAIKELSPRTPIILLTGWGQRMRTEGDIPAEVERVLAKPPRLRDLREVLATVLHM